MRGKRKQAAAGVWWPGRIRNITSSTTYQGLHCYGRHSWTRREVIEPVVHATYRFDEPNGRVANHRDTPALPFCDLILRAPQPLAKAYPTELRSLGDHLRKRRLDLGLLQREVALQIGVDPKTVWNWEKGKAVPSLRAVPHVVRFLAYDPRQEAKTFPDRIRQLRQGLGLSIEELAAKIGADPSTVQKWERLGYRPHPRLYARLAEILGIPEPPDDAPLPDRLRAQRLALGLTQKEAAAQIGVSQDTISRWERGQVGGLKLSLATAQFLRSGIGRQS